MEVVLDADGDVVDVVVTFGELLGEVSYWLGEIGGKLEIAVGNPVGIFDGADGVGAGGVLKLPGRGGGYGADGGVAAGRVLAAGEHEGGGGVAARVEAVNGEGRFREGGRLPSGAR